MMDLANPHNASRKRKEISNQHGIPLDFMDHILVRLRQANLITSMRGRNGGLKLVRAPEDISLLDIFLAVEETFYPVKCMTMSSECSAEPFCISHDAWTEVFADIQSILKQKTLAHLSERWNLKKTSFVIPQPFNSTECKAPH